MLCINWIVSDKNNAMEMDPWNLYMIFSINFYLKQAHTILSIFQPKGQKMSIYGVIVKAFYIVFYWISIVN